MSLLFLCDQCVPTEITETLRRHGHQVTLLREVLPVRSLDPVVIAKAQELGAILLSLNGDFADIVSYPPARYLGIIGIQLHNHPEAIPQGRTCSEAFPFVMRPESVRSPAFHGRIPHEFGAEHEGTCSDVLRHAPGSSREFREVLYA